ncbi:MAG: serine O-acetyltransferase [Pseudonocardiales bacterium]|nr:cysE [Jatrophihabitans sp.]MDT4904951.1 serine O-acetyltransferase [Pseudonocardiales bacterium]MDT4927836.1 serine O-acetyltransferase [Pseudonocardiales bacterium]MDT4948863.1 serine O-acetyltransferase [Pseudonocardiales bacterium]
MSSSGSGDQSSFRDLIFSDLARHRTDGKPTWLHVIVRSIAIPGMLASVILRSQQCLYRSGHIRLAGLLRMVGTILVGADFGPGMKIGTGLMIAHPVGVTIGYGLTIGNDVTLAGGVTAAARHYDRTGPQEFATICDGVTLGAHAVLIGNVRVGKNSTVGANSVVVTDVPDDCVVFGAPARTVSRRDNAAR